MKPEKATKLKKEIRDAAELNKLDLTNPANRYTLWGEHGPDLLCWSRADHPYEVHRMLGHLMLCRAIIFEYRDGGDGDQIIEFTSEVG